MAATANSLSGRKIKMEVELTAAIDTALSLGIATPPETLDISGIHMSIEQAQTADREVVEDYVTGDLNSILTPDFVLTAERYNVTILYTQGKDQLGSVNLDYYSDILLPLHNRQDALPLQHVWSPAGGNSGDEEYATDPDATYLVNVPAPVGGSSSEKIKVTYQIITRPVGEPAIIA